VKSKPGEMWRSALGSTIIGEDASMVRYSHR